MDSNKFFTGRNSEGTWHLLGRPVTDVLIVMLIVVPVALFLSLLDIPYLLALVILMIVATLSYPVLDHYRLWKEDQS